MIRRKNSTRQIVRLDRPTRAPESAVELLATSILQSESSLPLQRLVERIADELYRHELSYAWVLDIGILGSRVFAPGVAKEIERGDGSLWKIEKPEPGAANIGKNKHG